MNRFLDRSRYNEIDEKINLIEHLKGVSPPDGEEYYRYSIPDGVYNCHDSIFKYVLSYGDEDVMATGRILHKRTIEKRADKIVGVEYIFKNIRKIKEK